MEAMPREHADALNRKNIIEKRKEEAERREQEKQREEARCCKYTENCVLFEGVPSLPSGTASCLYRILYLIYRRFSILGSRSSREFGLNTRSINL